MQIRDALYIEGSWVKSTSSESIDVVDATTEEIIGRVPGGTPEDVDRAVDAAARAFPDWSARPIEERAELLERIVGQLEARADEIARLVTHEVGTTFEYSVDAQAGLPIADVATIAKVLREFPWEESIGRSLVVREPVGVVGAITPWNYPLHQITAKIAPALGAGCTVVVKPSGLAPLTAFVLAEIIHEVGMPAGVFNVVSGRGTVVGEAIASHPLVDMVSLTGSTRAGTRVMQLAAESVKRVALELGGKSATVILADVDFESVVPQAVTGCFRNSGQNCSALTRLIVPRSSLGLVEALARTAADGWQPGDPFDPGIRLGPLVSGEQRRRVQEYIRIGIDEGAKLLTGGPEGPAGLDRGYFVRPTVFSEVATGMRIAQEEIFGPVLSILAYDTEEEAIRLANDSPYGLSGAVWSADASRAEQVARRLRTGRVVVNGGPFNPSAPFGGYKRSGIGRELGRYGLEEYLEVKTLQR